MCRKVICKTCKKVTWAGCGQHIKSALNGVAIEDRCKGWETGKCPDAPPGSGSENESCVCT